MVSLNSLIDGKFLKDKGQIFCFISVQFLSPRTTQFRTEQYYGLCWRGRGWEDLGEWH